MRAAVMLVLVSACDAVFRLVAVAPPATTPDAAIDAPPPTTVTGTYLLHYVTNDATFSPMLVEVPFPAGSLSLSVRLDDGTTPDVTYSDADGSFSFPLTAPGQTYKLAVERAGAISEVQHSAPQLALVERLAGRPDRVPVTKPTMIDFQLGAINGAGLVASTGLWTFTGTGVVNTGTTNFSWNDAVTVDGPLGLLDENKHDRLFYIEYQNIGSGLQAYSNYHAVFPDSITQSDGSAVAVGGSLTPITSYQCAHLTTALTEEFARIESAVPQTYINAFYDFDIDAIPALDLGPFAPMWLMTGGTTVAPTVDIDMPAFFVDPYPGSAPLATMGVFGQFSLAVGSATPTVEYTQSRLFTRVDTSDSNCGNNIADVPAGVVAIAQSPTLGGPALVTKGQLVQLDLTNDVPLTWSMSPGGVDYTSVTLYELVNSGGVTALQPRDTIMTVTASVALDSSAFASGHTYILGITTVLGYPSAGAGNFDAASYPSGSTESWSQVFTVQAQ